MFNIAEIANFILLTLLVFTSFTIFFFRNLIINVVLMCIFSLLMALIYLGMNAPDVAITEASVGAGVSTVFMLLALSLIKTRKARSYYHNFFIVAVIIITFILFLYVIIDLPVFSDIDTPINKHVALYYIKNTETLIGIPNLVTAILAGFRAYDTFCETAVVFTAALGVSLILKKVEKDD